MSESAIEYYDLTHQEKRIYYIDKISSESNLHNIGGYLKINTDIDTEMMKKSINFLIETNETLRIRFAEVQGREVKYVESYENEIVDYFDFGIYENPIETCEIWMQDTFNKRFDLENNKLYYFAIFKLSDQSYGILLNIHHIISDGWSISLIQKRLCHIYTKLLKREEIDCSNFHSYIDYLEEEKQYLNSERFKKNREFWKQRFVTIPEDFLYKTSDTLVGNRLTFELKHDLSDRIRAYIKHNNYSLNTFFVFAQIIYIYKMTAIKDIVIGVPVFNRTNGKQKNTIGMFTSSMPFRFALNPNDTIERVLKSVDRQLKVCFVNQKYPYDLLVKDLGLSTKGYDSLYQMSVNYYNSKFETEIENVPVEVFEHYCGNQSYSMQLIIDNMKNDNIALKFDYKADEYDKYYVETMYSYLLNIITCMLDHQEKQIKNINIIGESELNDRIRVLNNTECAYPEKTVVELFKESVENNPDKTALEFEHQYVTYRELEERSNQLANFIINRGIKNNDRVAIMAVHSIELVVAILAVMKSGAAYVPLDPEYPSERIKFILRDSDSSLLLTNFDMEDGIQIGIELVNMNQLDWERYSDQAPESSNHWRDLAYIMYTSGSTGKPKGVMVEHRGLTNYAVWARKMYLKDEEESIPLYSSIGFDLTVTSIFVPLISGNKIVIYGKDEDDFELFRIIRENKVTVIKLTPAHLSLLKDLDIIKSSVKRLIVGGENLKVSLARSTADKFGQNIEIYNEYGPTEAVVGCMIHKFDQNRDTSTSVPIGLPADNVQIYILDDNLNIVPQGVIGNLYVSGHGISRGYLNREVLTEEKFIENLFIRGERMYRTGDTARYMKGGTLEYIGREDNQVKIRGHRVEMEEIENCLLDNSAVKRAVVYVKVDTNGNKTVNASIIGNETISDVELKQWLSKFLPQYMLPNHYFFMDDFPLTINGKIDYDRLPSMKVKDKDKEFQAPKNEMEVKFLAIMQEVLETDNISMNDNFYELGGDSIKALQISAKLANVGLNLKSKNLLTDDTLFSMAKHIIETKKIVNQEVASGTMPTTPIIKWFLRNQFVQENEYNQYVTLEFHRSLNIKDVTIAVNELIRHHDSLRINYNRANDKLFYNEAHQRDDIKVPCIQMGEKKDDLDNAIIEKASVNFNIESSILFQVTMFEYSEDQTIVLFTAHHLIVDGVSWRIIVEDFINILNQLKNNEEVKLPLKTTSLKAWSESLQAYGNYNFGSEKFFWKNILNKQFEYPVDYNNEMDTVENSFTINRILSESMTQNLKSIVRTSYNMQIDEALITSLIITLNKMTGKNEITIEIEKSGRKEFDDNIDISRTIGWFTTIFPAYFECYTERGEYDIRNLKEQLRKIPNGGFHYSMFSFEHSSNNFVRFNYLGDCDNIIKDSGIDLLTIGLYNHPKNLLTSIMDIGCMIRNRKLELFITYSRNKFRDESMESFINCYLDVLETYFAHGNTDRAVNGFTPSDFDAVDISQEDLNVLFL